MARETCQGLPDRPCPWLKCDNTVHNTIFDLFLCYDCEKIRVEAKQRPYEQVVDAAVAKNTAVTVTTRSNPIHHNDIAAVNSNCVDVGNVGNVEVGNVPYDTVTLPSSASHPLIMLFLSHAQT